MSFIDTDGKSSRFLTRAQKWAITNELAPRSSKKWLSTDTRSTFTTSASTSARSRSVPVVGPTYEPSVAFDSLRSTDRTSTDFSSTIAHASLRGRKVDARTQASAAPRVPPAVMSPTILTIRGTPPSNPSSCCQLPGVPALTHQSEECAEFYAQPRELLHSSPIPSACIGPS